MGIDTEVSRVFMRRKGRTIRHLEKHQDVTMDFHYYDTETGREFDVRELPDKYIMDSREDVHAGDSEAHKQVIRLAIDDGHDFRSKYLTAASSN